MTRSAEWIDGGVLIPDLLTAAPQTRPVLDRHGLRGCGGPLGPVESLGYFARAHEVPLPALLEELRQVAASPSAPAASEPKPDLGDAIYRPFFKAGIVVALTLGAVWGAYLLLRIAWLRSFAAAGLHEVNAHGHAQIFGWVGLFVMGFAYQAFPRFKHTALAHPRLAYASLWLMLAGLVVRSVGEPLAGVLPWAGPAAVGASLLEAAAVALFAWLVVRIVRGSGQGLTPLDCYILSALAWFVLQALAEPVYLAATLAAADQDQLIALVGTWQGALREVQIHGFALLMILGVSQRVLPNFYGLPAPSKRLSLAVLVCLNLAVAAEAVGLILLRRAGHGWAGLWYGGALLLAGGVVALVWNWKVFAASQEADRSLKFLRAAYGWLLASLALLALLPVYQHGLLPWAAPESDAARIGFSHAYYGAVRHAITVGFVSLMIVGVAAKVVPTLNGVDLRRLSALWASFLLLNAGCALRVTAQIATDFTPWAFPAAGASGLLEVLGLSLWGVHLWRIMAGRAGGRAPDDGPRALSPDAPVEAGDRVGAVLDRDPSLLDVFLAFGFRPLANRLLRSTLARFITVEQACRQQGVDLQQLLRALNAARAINAPLRYPLPLLPAPLDASCAGGPRASR
jgi:hypothetical protein